MARRVPLVSLALLILPATVAADSLHGLTEVAPIELEHRVLLKRSGTVVEFAAERRLENRGSEPDLVELGIELPARSVATSLRVMHRGRWVKGELLDAETASDRFSRSGTGKAPQTMLSYRPDGVMATVNPLAPGRDIRFEVGAVAPLCYSDGYYLVDYASRTNGLAEPRFRGAMPDFTLAPGARIPDRYAHAVATCNFNGLHNRSWLLWKANIRSPLAARYGRYRVNDEAQFWRLEIDIAPELAPIPKKARIVFVVDTSLSAGAELLRAQLELAAAYMEQIDDAEFEVVLYNRFPRRLFGSFVPAKRQSELSELRGSIQLDNGSHLERGVALAGSLLGKGTRPARIIAFTDGLTRDLLNSHLLAGALPAQSGDFALHIIDIGTSGAPYSSFRSDEHAFSPAAEQHGGMLLHIDGDPESSRASAASVTTQLIRPIEIHSFEVRAGDEVLETLFDPTIAAGTGLRQFELWHKLPAENEAVVVRGKLWGRPIEIPVSQSRSLSALLPKLAFGDLVASELSSEQELALARRAGVVTEQTSYLAAPTGASEGSLAVGGGWGSMSSCSGCIGGRIGCMSAPRVSFPHDNLRDYLAGQLNGPAELCRQLHGDPGDWMSVAVESTRNEVVDVSAHADRSELADCIAEAAWQLRLPDNLFYDDHLRLHIELGNY